MALVFSRYADTSFLVPLYVSEPASATAVRFFRDHAPAPLPWTPLSELEFGNALRLKVNRGEISDAEARGAIQRARADILDGFLISARLPAARHWRCAGELSRRHTVGLACRTLDVLHVAAALLCGAEEFLTFDVNQGRLAAAAGLTVRP